MQRANVEMDAMKPDIERNKVEVARNVVGANQNLKRDTLKLLDRLIEAGDIDAGFAITNYWIKPRSEPKRGGGVVCPRVPV